MYHVKQMDKMKLLLQLALVQEWWTCLLSWATLSVTAE